MENNEVLTNGVAAIENISLLREMGYQLSNGNDIEVTEENARTLFNLGNIQTRDTFLSVLVSYTRDEIKPINNAFVNIIKSESPRLDIGMILCLATPTFALEYGKYIEENEDADGDVIEDYALTLQTFIDRSIDEGPENLVSLPILLERALKHNVPMNVFTDSIRDAKVTVMKDTYNQPLGKTIL